MTDHIPEPTGARSLRPEAAISEVPAADVETPEAVVTALYDVISGPAESERERDWDRLRALMLPGARFVIARWPDDEGEPAEDLREWDVEGFVQDAKRFWRDEGFWERELGGRTERFGNVAHRMSSYASRVGSDDADPVSRGVNSFQLVRFGGRWWIASVVWDVETPERPIPEEYLEG